MSDREGHSGGLPPTDDDLSLPKATVAKMISGTIHHLFARKFVPSNELLSHSLELLPKDVVCAKETRDLVIECCVGEHKLSMTHCP